MRGRRLVLFAALATGLLAATVPATHAGAAPSPTGEFNYAEALQKAVWFYDAQREGRLPANNRVSWRADSFTSDGADANLDLVGGFADAGDHIKATFPLVHSLTVLAWGMIDYPQGYSTSSQSQFLLSNLRWGMDYLVKAHPAANRLVTEVADPNKDHQLWASAEVQTYPRDTYIMSSGCWGADLADSAAAAFAAASMVFKASDPTYANTLLTHATQLWQTTESLPKSKYDDCTPIVKGFYNSWSGFGDELVWGSLWLYRATGDQTYLTRAQAYYSGLPRQGQDQTSPVKYSWTLDWDDKTAASVILLAKLTGTAQYVSDARNWADFNAGNGVGGSKVTMSPGGEAFYGTWGSLRYAAGAAFIAFVLSDAGVLDATHNVQLHDFAVRQINYILGDNPSRVSYMVGFGTNYIKRPHHRTAHGSWSNNYAEPVDNRHILYGGLIGGPTAADDNYGPEDRNAFQKAEVALDYNAGLTSALARMVKEYGGTPLANFPQPETPDKEIFVQASLNQANTNFVEIKSLVYNHTAFPARFTTNLSLRYYFTLDAGMSPSQVVLSKAYAQCADPSGPTQLQGSTYYVTINCAGQNIAPIGQSESRRENQFRITFPGAHDYTKDWSFQGVSPTQSTPTDAPRIAIYAGTTLVGGTPPNTGTVTPPSAPGTPTASGVTAAQATLSWTASAPGTNPVASYDVYRVASGGDVKVASTAGLTATVTGLAPSTAYTFYVKAVDTGGTASAASGTVNVTTLAPPPPPSAPGQPTASAVTATGVTLTWTASTPGGNPIGGYQVFRVATGGDVQVASTNASTLTAALSGLAPTTSYSFYIKAVDTTGFPSAASPSTPVTTAQAPPATVKAQYKNNDSNPTDNQIRPGLQLVNGGTSAVALSTVTIRYYFTGEAGSTSYTTNCDYAQVGQSNVRQTVVTLASPVTGADRYLEVSFTATAGNLAPGASSGDIQSRFNKNDWSNFNEANDYSFATNTSYVDATKITVFVNGQLVWGTPPG